MKYLVLELNQDEFGRGISRPVHQFNTTEELHKFLFTYHGDISRLEVFEAKPLDVKLTIG